MNENTISDEITEDEAPTLDDDLLEAACGGLREGAETPIARHPPI